MTDNEILDLYLERDEAAIEKTEEKYGKYCYSIAYKILANIEDSNECVNDTYMGAWNSIPPHKPERLSLYLGKITRRGALNIWRKRDAKKRGEGENILSLDELSECVQGDNSIEKYLEAKEITAVLNYFLSELSDEGRLIFLRRYYYMDSIEEISKLLYLGKSKVKTTLYRQRMRLKELLYSEGIYL